VNANDRKVISANNRVLARENMLLAAVTEKGPEPVLNSGDAANNLDVVLGGAKCSMDHICGERANFLPRSHTWLTLRGSLNAQTIAFLA